MGRASLRLLLRRAVLFALVTTTAMAYHSFASRDLMQGTLPERRESTDESSLDAIIRVRRCTSGACPYSASWLAHRDLFRRVRWRLSSTKMEQASFVLMQQTQDVDIFQMSDPDAVYVNHLSEYEHLQRKKTHNLTTSLAMEATMSEAAARGECSLLISTHNTRTDILGLMPFYGGAPPDVDERTHRVRSIGEGNSLASRAIKAKQGVATACSLLRYFGTVAIAVSSNADFDAITTEVLSHGNAVSIFRDRVIIVQFRIARGSHLPFYLLSWAQLQVYYCPSADLVKNRMKLSCDDFPDALVSEVHRSVVRKDVSLRSRDFFYIYYTEADQLLRFDHVTTLNGIASASNRTTVILGRRRHKLVGSGARALPPEQYSEGLARGRGCGQEGYYFPRWTKNNTTVITAVI